MGPREDQSRMARLLVHAAGGGFLLVFLTYPLGLGVWLGFTDTRIGRAGTFIGLENYELLWNDFDLLALRLQHHPVHGSALRSSSSRSACGWPCSSTSASLSNRSSGRCCSCPSSCRRCSRPSPSGGSTTPQFSVISWALIQLGIIDAPINFLGSGNNARASVIVANVWRGIPFVAITLLAGLQTIPPSLHEAATLDGATHWQQVPPHHPADAVAADRRGDDLLGAVHLHRLPAHLRPHARRAAQRHAPDGDLELPARHSRWTARRGRGHRRRHDPVPARSHPVQLFRAAAAALAAGRAETDAMGG